MVIVIKVKVEVEVEREVVSHQSSVINLFWIGWAGQNSCPRHTLLLHFSTLPLLL
jgi:hypothetical protein